MSKARKVKKYKNSWPIIAICYDFDRTLSPRDMQDYSLIPKLNLKPDEFWAESNKLAAENGMDKMLSYMRLIIEKADHSKQSIRTNDFKEMGKAVELYEGVDIWFERINEYGIKEKVNIEHYIISSGLKEIIEGTPIAKEFTYIFASCFLYEEGYCKPYWPKQAVNFTTKTQYLFRINKGCLDLGDEESVNKYMPKGDRRIPFSNFIYIGDSATDIPAMSVVYQKGGHSIGVYDPKETNIKNVFNMISQERINYFSPADYKEESMLDKLVKDIISQIKVDHECSLSKRELDSVTKIQKKLAIDYSYLLEFYTYVKFNITEHEVNMQTCEKYLSLISEFFNEEIKRFRKKYKNYADIGKIVKILRSKKNKVEKMLKGRIEKLTEGEKV